MLAALCCLPLLEFGEEGLRGWSQLIVYPDAFRVNRTHVDAAGVLHEWEDELIGEAWEAGPVILSWADVMADCEDPRAGFCVASARNGAQDRRARWRARRHAAVAAPMAARVGARLPGRVRRTRRQVDAGRETAIDGYAAEAPEEFFAVVTEYHFSDPALLRRTMPKVAAHLERFYGASPFA